MLRPRLIPCLLVKSGGLVKTVYFGSPKYVGDPINAVRIFNEKEVDELIVLDIDASVAKREPDYTMVANLAAECRMPLCYGGGVRSVEHAKRIIAMGVEKIAISSAAIDDPDLISRIAEMVGSQSVVVVIDAKRKKDGSYEVRKNNGATAVRGGVTPVELARCAQRLGAGEVVLNSIDRDGTREGYDFDLIADVRAAVTLPLTVLGGAGSLDDVAHVVRRFGTVGVAAGSLFVFKGVHRAVLINYPSREVKDELFRPV